MTGELARQIDASATTLGDVAQVGQGTILEFRVMGQDKSWMKAYIPKGIKVTIPGWLVVAGLVGSVLAAVAAMAAARGVMDFMAARRLLAEATREEAAEEEEAEETAAEGRAAARDHRREWELAYIAFSREFRDINDRSPNKAEQDDWIADNPMPPLGK